ncbi:MAG: nuclear transport factor 2 family protein [Bacteroidia bacterium]|nr:nuclear transport factor 2 family protein [Bacteroidia bacterium]
MKKKFLLPAALVILFSLMFNSLTAQTTSGTVKNEIMEALKLWNAATKAANTNQLMSLYDNSENIMLVGSDSAEIWKGKDQIKGHVTEVFTHSSFYWEMDRIDIDNNGDTAWAVVDGSMVIKTDTGETMKTPYRFAEIFVKRNGTWKLRIFHGSIPKAG